MVTDTERGESYSRMIVDRLGLACVGHNLAPLEMSESSFGFHLLHASSQMCSRLKSIQILNPITALASVQPKSGRLLLCGEGPNLRVYDYKTSCIYQTVRIFDSSIIHGIAVTGLAANENDCESFGLLIWGGRWINYARIKIATVQTRSGIHVEAFVKVPVQVEDWILDVQFRPSERSCNTDDCVSSFFEAVLVTAHHAILSFQLWFSDPRFSTEFKPLITGLNTVLYSAHIIWDHYGQLFVAAGAVCGEAIFSSIFTKGLLADSPSQPFNHLSYRFAGHEGSVFGIRISDDLTTAGLNRIQRVLATCGDDRTIRIWDLSDLNGDFTSDPGGEERATESSAPPVDDKGGRSFSRSIAKAMGHASRIWDLRFLPLSSGLRLLSLGEDGTTQLWYFCEELASGENIGLRKSDTIDIKSQESYQHHNGKSIWSAIVFEKSADFHTCCTGGADGRIVAYDINATGDPGTQESFFGHWSMSDLFKVILREGEDAGADKHDNDTISKRIFDGLAGTWKINRSIKSALATYPSGSFEGIASFESRPPTADMYDAEYLYVENGKFVTDQGLSFHASRRYVYRFQEMRGVMSAWFVRTDDNSGVDYLFHDVEFDNLNLSNLQDPMGNLSVKAKGYHLCIQDHYTPHYEFLIADRLLTNWSLAYTVKGPQKDYLAEASYAREVDVTSGDDLGQMECIGPQDKIQAQYLQLDTISSQNSFKNYTWIDRNSVIMTTAQGQMILGKVETEARSDNEETQSNKYLPFVTWKDIGTCAYLKTASVLSQDKAANFTFLGGNDGTIYRYNNADRSAQLFTKLPGKVAFLHTFKNIHRGGKLVLLATCIGSSVAYVVGDEGKGLNEKETYFLTLPENFVVTSAHHEESLDILMVGSRNGAVAVYDTHNISTESAIQYIQHVTGIHGEETVTSIVGFPGHQFKTGAYFLTCGRDAKFSVHRISFMQNVFGRRDLKFGTIHQCTPPLGPNIEGAAFDMITQDLFIWGFRGKRFIVWNATKDMVSMNVECGGAHRSWSYNPLGNSSGGGAFVWTKASKCYLRYELQPSHRIFQPGGHGREIKAVAISPLSMHSAISAQKYLATGAEDTDIRIFSFTSGSEVASGFRCLATLKKHTTGIQQLRWSPNGRLLFSAAGCEEFFVWRVHQIPLLVLGIICEAICPTVSEEGDLRIMDFSISEIETEQTSNQSEKEESYLFSLVYSDSSLRIYHYISSPTNPSFHLLQQGIYSTHCLTQSLHLRLNTHATLCTTSSDGHLAFWPLPTIQPSKSSQRSNLHPLTSTSVHQNSVKSATSCTLPFSPSTTLIFTGGDDGALGITITRLLISSPPPHTPPPLQSSSSLEPLLPSTSTLLIPKAHAAAVTAVLCIPTHRIKDKNSNSDSYNYSSILITASTDQRIKFWRLSLRAMDSEPQSETPDTGMGVGVGVEDMDIDLLDERPTSVGDVSAMAFMENEDGEEEEEAGGKVVVVGIGMEVFEFGCVL